MLDRFVILLAFVVVVIAVVLGARLWARVRLRKLQANAPAPLWRALGTAPDGRPTVVTFSSLSCRVCHTTQAPVIQKLEETLGESALRVLKVDVAVEPDVAAAFGVLTVPTTVILSSAGQVHAANHGFASFPRLVEQIRRAAVA